MAFRYALGRQTYVVSDVVETIIRNWDELSSDVQHKIKIEIEEAISRDMAGHEMDVKQWKKVLKCISK